MQLVSSQRQVWSLHNEFFNLGAEANSNYYSLGKIKATIREHLQPLFSLIPVSALSFPSFSLNRPTDVQPIPCILSPHARKEFDHPFVLSFWNLQPEFHNLFSLPVINAGQGFPNLKADFQPLLILSYLLRLETMSWKCHLCVGEEAQPWKGSFTSKNVRE